MPTQAGRMILYGQWTRSLGVMRQWSARSHKATDAAIRDEAHFFVRRAIKKFKTSDGGRWKKLSPITLALRRGGSAVGAPSTGGRKPLVRTGSLRRSIKVYRQGVGNYFAGVHRKSGRSSGLGGAGPSLVNVAQIHETGMVVIPITDKMRSYFRWLFWKGVIPFPWPPPSKRYILIPQRSFLATALKDVAHEHEARLMLRYTNYLQGGKALRLDSR